MFIFSLMSNTDHCNIKNPEGGLFELTKIHIFTGFTLPRSVQQLNKTRAFFRGRLGKKSSFNAIYLIRTIIVGNSQHFVCS